MASTTTVYVNKINQFFLFIETLPLQVLALIEVLCFFKRKYKRDRRKMLTNFLNTLLHLQMSITNAKLKICSSTLIK
jgi:hypothetical protein